jgi:DNA repair exonuclease SbcCD nuclease subunit
MIRFLHTADLHLGLRVTRFEQAACNRISEARFEAVEQIRASAIEHRIHFVLIAGDVFDDQTVSRVIAERAFAIFEDAAMPCPVFVIPGNHDPLTPGGVWDRDPWKGDEPPNRIRLLREPMPVPVPDLPVTIFPCPLRNRNSVDDPTTWIANHPRGDDDRRIRIGLAHGSLNLFPNLPLDDHLIRVDAADHYSLDYLALGHWHKVLRHRSADGAERTAYSGTHEPMRFPGTGAALSTGWISYSGDGDAERFQDEGHGTALLVSIDEAGAPPQIDTIEVGRLRWIDEHQDVTAQSLDAMISHYAEREGRALTLLRLRLSGVLDPQTYQQVDSVLCDVVRNRYCAGSSVDMDAVLVEPQREELSMLVGDGVLKRVLGRLHVESESTESAVKRVADHALKLLYRIAWEEQSK